MFMSKVPFGATLLAILVAWCAVSCQSTTGVGADASASPTTAPAVAASAPAADSGAFPAIVSVVGFGVMGLCVYMLRGAPPEMVS